MPAPATVNRAFLLLAVVLIAGLSAYLLYPALFLDRSLVHGDNVHHGYSFLKFHHDVIHHGVSPLWTNLVYGGHALFAEGQAGLSNPVNYLVAWLLRPEYGHNLLHWLAMTAFGVGCYGLCRALSIRPASSLFAALAAGFSSLMIHSNTSLTGIEAQVWVPWTMWAFEAWLARPGPRRAILFGLSTAMLVFSGYPHFLHGTVIYMLASLCTLLAGGPLRDRIPNIVSTYWRTALLAVIVCVGISCIQWLPLLELAALSHRNEGVGIAINGTPEFIIRGLLYSTDNVARTETLNPAWFPNTGSLVVCVLASLCLLVPCSARIKGHIVATVLLLNLGFGSLSPVYRFVTQFGLIPGIDSFRMMFPYFFMSVIGIAALAGNTLDGLGARIKQPLRPLSGRAALGWGLMLLFWCFVLWRYHSSAAPATNYLILGLAAAGLPLLAVFRKQDLYPLYACLLLLAEILLLKLAPFGTVDTSLLTREPEAARYIRAQENASLFRHLQLGLVTLTFSSPYSDALEGRTRHELNNLVASTNLLWGIPSFSGALALMPRPKPLTDEAVRLEIGGSGDSRPGARLMDILSIKWISGNTPGTATSRHLRPVKNANGQRIVWENPYARPMIQTYPTARFVANAEEALQALQADQPGGLLYVEADPAPLPQPAPGPTDASIRLQTVRASPTRYRFLSSAESGYWLFLADSYHPGWKASIDEQPANIYPAQVLGKALFIPAGEHRVKIYFQSDSFRLGALVSLATALCLLLYGLRAVSRYLRSKP